MRERLGWQPGSLVVSFSHMKNLTQRDLPLACGQSGDHWAAAKQEKLSTSLFAASACVCVCLFVLLLHTSTLKCLSRGQELEQLAASDHPGSFSVPCSYLHFLCSASIFISFVIVLSLWTTSHNAPQQDKSVALPIKVWSCCCVTGRTTRTLTRKSKWNTLSSCQIKSVRSWKLKCVHDSELHMSAMVPN